MTITTQVKTTIQNEIVQLTHMTISNQYIKTEPENETKLINQESQPTNEDSTDMNLEKEQHKRKERPVQKAIERLLLSTLIRLSR